MKVKVLSKGSKTAQIQLLMLWGVQGDKLKDDTFNPGTLLPVQSRNVVFVLIRDYYFSQSTGTICVFVKVRSLLNANTIYNKAIFTYIDWLVIWGANLKLLYLMISGSVYSESWSGPAVHIDCLEKKSLTSYSVAGLALVFFSIPNLWWNLNLRLRPSESQFY